MHNIQHRVNITQSGKDTTPTTDAPQNESPLKEAAPLTERTFLSPKSKTPAASNNDATSPAEQDRSPSSNQEGNPPPPENESSSSWEDIDECMSVMSQFKLRN